MSAARVGTTYELVIGNNNEVSWGFRGLRGTRVDRASEAEDQVIRGSAREVAAVANVGPTWVRLVEEGPAVVVNVLERDIVEEVRGNLVRVVMVTLKNDRPFTTH